MLCKGTALAEAKAEQFVNQYDGPQMCKRNKRASDMEKALHKQAGSTDSRVRAEALESLLSRLVSATSMADLADQSRLLFEVKAAMIDIEERLRRPDSAGGGPGGGGGGGVGKGGSKRSGTQAVAPQPAPPPPVNTSFNTGNRSEPASDSNRVIRSPWKRCPTTSR